LNTGLKVSPIHNMICLKVVLQPYSLVVLVTIYIKWSKQINILIFFTDKTILLNMRESRGGLVLS